MKSAVDLFGQEQVVKLVDAHIALANLSHSLLEHGVSDQVLFDLGVGFEGLVHSVALTLVEVLGDLGSLVHVGLQAGRLGQLEDVCVEGGHLGADVVEQVRLLHVVALDAHGDLLVQLILSEFEGQKLVLSDHHLDGTVHRRERVKSELGKTVGLDGVESVVGLGGIVDKED
eukprot:CAMPEP_0170470762 /NCGR_PEP_ID=MMETSP0123-20130129/13129_1 /TAXON_ID=182087 /ORGANISM="Favella ehrenbergii, Strain Fehren 1" /LENGTH=171 /DNA_ID=CAMNT_0010738029 /DNA_START=64 /DNA_END=580 /DNA_ORIENTATION=-